MSMPSFFSWVTTPMCVVDKLQRESPACVWLRALLRKGQDLDQNHILVELLPPYFSVDRSTEWSRSWWRSHSFSYKLFADFLLTWQGAVHGGFQYTAFICRIPLMHVHISFWKSANKKVEAPGTAVMGFSLEALWPPCPPRFCPPCRLCTGPLLDSTLPHDCHHSWKYSCSFMCSCV